MKARDIRIGDLYIARVSRKDVPVRVDAIRRVRNYLGKKMITVYDVTNTETGRNLQFRSPARFRRPAVMATIDEMMKNPPPADMPKGPRPRFDFREGKIVFKKDLNK